MARQTGIRPNPVIKDPRADAFLIFLDLRFDLDAAGLTEFLERLGQAKLDLETVYEDGSRVASAVVAFGRPLFQTDGAIRFGLEGRMPAELAAPPEVPGLGELAAGNRALLIYVMSTSESVVAEFQRALAETGAVSGAVVERGFQRRDRKEPFGFRDGLRNVASPERDRVIYLDRTEAPDEPFWCEDGSYLAYIKVEQHLDVMASLPPEEQEAVIGRHKDGVRLDLDESTPPGDEPAFTSAVPTPNAHVRKAGPRGPGHDSTQIFRRGVPYANLSPDGSLETGLHFVSFQRSLDYLDAILSRWMLNDAFPAAGAGIDRLFAPLADGRQLVTVRKAGFYFVPPAGDPYIGAGLFAPMPAAGRPRGPGRIALRKRAVDANGSPIKAELGGAGFQVFRSDTNEAVTEVFFTDSAGHATSPETIPLRIEVVVREVQPQAPNTQLVEEPRLTLTRRQELVRVTNRVSQAGPGYGG